MEDELLASCLQQLKQKPQPTSSSDQLFGQYIGQQLQQVPEGYRTKVKHANSSRSVLHEFDGKFTVIVLHYFYLRKIFDVNFNLQHFDDLERPTYTIIMIVAI